MIGHAVEEAHLEETEAQRDEHDVVEAVERPCGQGLDGVVESTLSGQRAVDQTCRERAIGLAEVRVVEGSGQGFV